MTDRPRQVSPETLAAQALRRIDPQTGAVVPALHAASTFARGDDYEPAGGHVYSRDGAPTVEHAEAILAALDRGEAALVFASGLAATAAVFETVPPGGHVVAPRTMYHGAQDWLRRLDRLGRLRLSLFDETDAGALAAAIRPGETALAWIETPANPTWTVSDIAAAARAAHAAGAALVVDSTAAPPPTTRALDLGADIVFHSATKYLNGHSDLTAGALITRNDDGRWRDIGSVRTHSGGVLGAFEAWLLIRGLRTLHVRFARQCDTAMTIARHFETHARVARVLYPGLVRHPGHDVARRQMTGGFGGMLSILVDGDAAAAKRVATAARVFVPATSLGGVESLIEHRRSVQSPESEVAENLLRLSIGLESPDDLIDDLERALRAI